MRRVGAIVLMALLALACATTTAPPTNCWTGLRGEYVLGAREGHDRDEVALADAARIIGARLNAMGLARFDVRTGTDFKIEVDLSPMADVNEVRNVLVATGIVLFVPIPEGVEVAPGDSVPDGLGPLFGQEAVLSARPSLSAAGQSAIEIVLRPEVERTFSDYTRNNVGRQLAIALDNIVVSAPVINEPLEATFEISGGADQAGLPRLVSFLTLPPIPGSLREESFGPVTAPATCVNPS